jgi:hypothetical protein
MARGRKEERPLKKMTTRFYEDDLVYLKLSYPHAGYNGIVRALVAKHVRQLRNLTVEHLEGVKLTEEELRSV